MALLALSCVRSRLLELTAEPHISVCAVNDLDRVNKLAADNAAEQKSLRDALDMYKNSSVQVRVQCASLVSCGLPLLLAVSVAFWQCWWLIRLVLCWSGAE